MERKRKKTTQEEELHVRTTHTHIQHKRPQKWHKQTNNLRSQLFHSTRMCIVVYFFWARCGKTVHYIFWQDVARPYIFWARLGKLGDWWRLNELKRRPEKFGSETGGDC